MRGWRNMRMVDGFGGLPLALLSRAMGRTVQMQTQFHSIGRMGEKQRALGEICLVVPLKEWALFDVPKETDSENEFWP